MLWKGAEFKYIKWHEPAVWCPAGQRTGQGKRQALQMAVLPTSFFSLSGSAKRALQAAEGWPRSLQPVGLRWAACSGTMNLEPPRKEVGFSVQIFLGHLNFTSSVSLSPWVVKCPKMPTSSPPNYISGSGTKAHLKCHPVLASESMVRAHTNEFSRQIMLNTLSFSF